MFANTGAIADCRRSSDGEDDGVERFVDTVVVESAVVGDDGSAAVGAARSTAMREQASPLTTVFPWKMKS